MNRKKLILGALLVLGVSLFAWLSHEKPNLQPVLSTAGIFEENSPDHHHTGKTMTIIDKQGEVLCKMARSAFAGDKLYTAEGQIYLVNKVWGDRAQAQFEGIDQQIEAYNEYYTGQDTVPAIMELAEKKNGNIAVYHTHSSESYVPSDGKESVPFKGSIFQVGGAMVDTLKRKGFEVKHSQNPHDPHDNNAYARSRRTAAELMKNEPAAIFDVHRDGIEDANYYRSQIEGKNVAKLRLVVGRENPRMNSNLDFAKRLMAAANKMHPNVVREIYVGKGNYNQDLMPNALLLEAGTYTNRREEAENGVAMLADAVPAVLGTASAAPAVPGAGGGTSGTAAEGGSWKALGWIIGLVVAGGLGFLLISSGSWENAKKRILSFGRELTGFLGPRRPVLRRSGSEHHAREKKVPEVYEPDGSEVLKDVKDDLTKD
jgi:stage II sporulation protein P